MKYDDILYNVVISTDTDPEVWIILVITSNSRVQVMLYQEDDPYLNDKWLDVSVSIRYKVQGSDV